MNNDLLKPKDVIKLLSISRPTLLKYVKEGKIKSILISSRGDRRYAKEEIDRFVNRENK